MDSLLVFVALSIASLSASPIQDCTGRQEEETRVETEGNRKSLSCKGDQWLTLISFVVINGRTVQLKEGLCVEEFCCEKHLINKFKGKHPLNFYGWTPLGVSVDLRCREPGHMINKTTATCVSTTANGDGWDILEGEVCSPCPPGTSYDNQTNTCPPCGPNTFSNRTGAAACTPCDPTTSFSPEVGATQCECKRGLLRNTRQDNVCEFCPAGHTTYRGHPGVCVGPQLYGLRVDKSYLGKFIVKVKNLGSLVTSNMGRWQSAGDWIIKKSSSTKRSRLIRQKYTLSRKRKPFGAFSFRVRDKITFIAPKINDIYCSTGDGKNYRGYLNTTWTGKSCSSNCEDVNFGKACFCRYSHHAKKIGCVIDGGAFEHCDIPRCSSVKRGTVTGCSYNATAIPSLVKDLLDKENGSLRGLDKNNAQETCDRMGRECKGIWEDSLNTWRLSRIDADLFPHEGKNEFLVKEASCQPYYEEYFSQTFE